MYWIHWFIGLVGRVFANGLGDLGSIPGCVIPRTLKMVLDTSLLNTQRYKVCIEGKVEQSRESSSSYWKGSLQVDLDYGRQLYFYLYVPENYLRDYKRARVVLEIVHELEWNGARVTEPDWGWQYV